MAEPFPLVEVSGPPRERGRQYGHQAAARIHLGVEHYTAAADPSGARRRGHPHAGRRVRSPDGALRSRLRRGDARHRRGRGPGLRVGGAAQRADRDPQARPAARSPGATRRRRAARTAAPAWWRCRTPRRGPADPRAELGLESRVRRDGRRPVRAARRRPATCSRSPRRAGSHAPASTRRASRSPPTISSPTATTGSSACRWRSSAAKFSRASTWRWPCARCT